MLAHELAHPAANDPVWYLLADLTTAVFWWHPFVWSARRRLHAASETAAFETMDLPGMGRYGTLRGGVDASVVLLPEFLAGP